MSAGIPTEYKGVRFRSRLEATWAAFLDEIGCEWRYEAIDLKGYIPDFILPTRKLLIEVKPSLDPTDLWEHVGKIERSDWTDGVLVVGASVPLTRAIGLGISRQLGAWTYEKRTHLLSETTGEAIEEAWKRAKNITQWMPAAPSPVRVLIPASVPGPTGVKRPDDPLVNRLIDAMHDRPSLRTALFFAVAKMEGSVLTLGFDPGQQGFVEAYRQELTKYVKAELGQHVTLELAWVRGGKF